MTEIKNYTLKEFVKLSGEDQESYARLLSFVKPVETKKTLWDLKYKDVEGLKSEGSENFEVFVETLAKMQGVKPGKIWSVGVVEFFGLLNYLKEQIKVISKAEQNIQSKEINVKWEAVGGSERMAKFKIYNALIPLAEQFGWTFDHIQNMTYGEVFTTRYYNSTMGDLNREMANVKIN